MWRRRNGHNELDDPSTTLPLTYRRIMGHDSVVQQYGARLLEEGAVTAAELHAWEEALMQEYEKGAPRPLLPPARHSPAMRGCCSLLAQYHIVSTTSWQVSHHPSVSDNSSVSVVPYGHNPCARAFTNHRHQEYCIYSHYSAAPERA